MNIRQYSHTYLIYNFNLTKVRSFNSSAVAGYEFREAIFENESETDTWEMTESEKQNRTSEKEIDNDKNRGRWLDSQLKLRISVSHQFSIGFTVKVY